MAEKMAELLNIALARQRMAAVSGDSVGQYLNTKSSNVQIDFSFVSEENNK